jgi:hypothetical protein
MCDIDKDEEPTYEVDNFGTAHPLADTIQAMVAIGDNLDLLAQLELRSDLQGKIRAEVIAMLNAMKLLIVKPDDLSAIIAHSHAANHLHDLAEEVMIAIEEHNTKEEAATDGR